MRSPFYETVMWTNHRLLVYCLRQVQWRGTDFAGGSTSDRLRGELQIPKGLKARCAAVCCLALMSAVLVG